MVYFSGTLKWTRYQPTHQYPDPCKWHTVISVTARFKKGDQSVRTTSLPHLKNKLRKNQKRPKSSPIYSSARYSRKTPDHLFTQNRPSTLAIKTDDAQECNDSNSKSEPIEMTTYGEKNMDRRSPFKGNGFTESGKKPVEEKSPLLCNRQASKDSVVSTGSNLGTDNPCLELDSSCERLDNFNTCSHSNGKVSVSVEMTDLTPFATPGSPRDNSQVVTRFVKNNKPKFETSAIPGQVNMSPNNDDIYSKNIFSHNPSMDLMIEDLEFSDNYFSKGSKTEMRSKPSGQYLSDRNVKYPSDHDLKIKQSTFNETEFNGHMDLRQESNLDGKSFSLSDIIQSQRDQDNAMYKAASMHLPSNRSIMCQNLNCWVEETEDSSVEDMSQVKVNSSGSPSVINTHSSKEDKSRIKIANQSKPTEPSEKEVAPSTVNEVNKVV